MDHLQRNGDDDYSTLTFNQPLKSLSAMSSTTSILDSTSKTTSLLMSKQSNINVNHLRNRTRSLKKRHYQQRKQISSSSTTTTTTSTILTERQEELLRNDTKIQKQEARPLGTCVRKCGQCQHLKHILLAECTVCFRMMDVDLKDCKCQILTSRNIIDHFICSICNSELTLDAYIICANRTCQTTLSSLIKIENTNEIEAKSTCSATLTNICYPKSTHRTVAIQINTLNNLSPIQRFLSTIIDDENRESSSCSKDDLNQIINTSSGTSHLSMDSGVDASQNDIARNMIVGFNSNQPTKLTLQSEEEPQQQQSQIHTLTHTNDTKVNNNPEFSETPKSPRCLAIMNVNKRRDRLSTLLTLSTNKTCQTQLSCLVDIDKKIEDEELSNANFIRTNDPNKIERQIQIDTIKGRFDDLCQVQIEITDGIEKDSISNVMNDEKILQVLTDKDGQRWSEFIEQLINEQSNISPSEKARQLLDAIERMHPSGKLNSLTTGQLQRKVRYAMSQFKRIDEHSYLQNKFKPTKNIRSETSPRRNSECNGRMDMSVTVRQIDKLHNHPTEVSSEQNWRPYVDRLFEQGHSANEIQRLLHEAIKTTRQSDDQRLQDVFNYINIKTNQQRVKTAPSGFSSIKIVKDNKSVERQQVQPTNLFHSVKSKERAKSSGGIMILPSSFISERKGKSNELSPVSKDKNQDSITKNKSSLLKSDIIQVQSLEKISTIDLNEDAVTNPNTSTIDKKQSINSAETSNEKKSTTDNVSQTLKEKANQIKKVIESKTSETSSFDHRKNSLTSKITPSTKSNDTPSKNLEEKCINALLSVQNSFDNIPNNDVRLHSHLSNTQSKLNQLINTFESHLYKSDNIELLMTQCIEHLNNEKTAIVPRLEESHIRNLNEKISNTLNLLQEYKKIVIPTKTNNEDSPFNRNISNMITVSSDTPGSLKQVKENIEQTIESRSPSPSKTILDLQQHTNTLEYHETAKLIRCRHIPYTSSNEKKSAVSLEKVLICSTEHISLKFQDPDEQLRVNKSELNDVSKTEDDLYNNQSQTEWLDSLFSKMSNNVSDTPDIISASPSLSVADQLKVDLNEEPINMKIEDEQIPTINNRSRSSIPVHHPIKNVSETTNDSQSILYETDVIRLEEEHAMSIIVPDQDISVLDEQFQIVHTKVSQTKSIISSKQALNSKDQLAPIQNEEFLDNIQKESLNLNDDSDDNTSQKSASVTNLSENNFDEEKRSTSSIIDDQLQPMTTQSLSHSNVDLSEQLDQLQIYDSTTCSEQLVADSTSASEDNFQSPQKQLNSKNGEKIISSESVSGQITSSEPDNNTSTGTSTKSSLSHDKEEGKEKSTTIFSSSRSNENKDQDLMKTNESDVYIEKTSDSSQSDVQAFDGHATLATVHQQNGINKLRLPSATQHLDISNSIKSNSPLTHLNNHDHTDSSNKSISNSNPASDVQEHLAAKISPNNSENQNIVAIPIQNSDDKQSLNEEIDDIPNDVIQTPILLPPNHSIVQQPTNIVLSPIQTIKLEVSKYKKLTTPSSFPLKPTSYSKQFTSKHDSIPRLLIKESPESIPSLVKALTKDNDHDDDNRSDTSMSSAQDIPIDNWMKEDLRNKLDHNNDKLHTEQNLPVRPNVSAQESSSFDNATDTATKLSGSIQSLAIGQTDEQQSNTSSTMNKKYSRPKILIEDVETPLVLTPHSSVLLTTLGDETQKKSKQQFEKKVQSMPEDTESSSDENQSDKTPIQSYTNEKSSTNESNIPNLAVENTVKLEHSTTEYDKSEENSSVHSAFQSEQSQYAEDYQSERKNSLRIESLIKLLPSPPNKQSMTDNHSGTEDALDHIHPPYIIDYDSKSKDQLDNQKPSYSEQYLSPTTLHSITNRVKSSSSVMTKKPPMTSTVTAVLPSSTINVKMQERKLKSRLSSLKNKNSKSSSEEIQEAISISAFNLAQLTSLTPNNHNEIQDKKSLLQSKKNFLDDASPPPPIISKQQSSSTNSLVRNDMPVSSVSKLLLKRSSIKQTSTTVPSTKPNTTLSITDISTSSNNTITTDHYSTINNHEQIRTLKKATLKDGFRIPTESIPKRNILRKTSRPLKNPVFVSRNRKEKFTNNHLLTNSELTYDTESGSEQIFMLDEHYEGIPQRQQKKQNKNRIPIESRRLPLKLKTHNDDHQAYPIDSSKLPSIEQTSGQHHLKKQSNNIFPRPIIRLPITQIEKFECGTIGPHIHPSSIAHQIFSLPSIHEHSHFSSQINPITESFTDRLYSLMSPEHNIDKQAFESILHWQHQYQTPKIEQNKFQYMYLLDTSSTKNSIRGKQYPILTDEIDMIDDPNACTIVNKWAFADLVNSEREKFIQKSSSPLDNINVNKRIKICLRKRPLTKFEENIFKEVDIISIVEPQTMLLHIPSITVDNQVFIKNRKFKFDQTFDEHCQMNIIYNSTITPLLNMAIDGSKCLCLIGGGKYSGKTYLLRCLIDLLSYDLNRLLSTYDIYIKLLGICHNRIVNILQNYSPIRLIKSMNWILIPNDEFHIENTDDINYITCQIKRRRRFMHQLIQINFREKNQLTKIGSLMFIVLASSQYVYTRNLCSHRRKFLINSLNKTILSFKRALLGIRQNPDRIRTAFNNDILTRLIQPYIFHSRSNICYIGTLNPGHRHRIATKSTMEFARNLRFCLKHINKKRRRQRKNYVECE